MTIKEWFNMNRNSLFIVNGKRGFIIYINDEYISMDFGAFGGITKIKLTDIKQMELIEYN